MLASRIRTAAPRPNCATRRETVIAFSPSPSKHHRSDLDYIPSFVGGKRKLVRNAGIKVAINCGRVVWSNDYVIT